MEKDETKDIKTMLVDYLYDETNTISLDEALLNVNKKLKR